MRRIWWATALVLTLVFGLAAGAWGAESIRRTVEVEYKGIQIRVDGKVVSVDAEPFLLVDMGRTFVPARALAEALGARVGWDADTNTVQVFTESYAQTRAGGDWATWSMPYWGFSVQVPANLSRQDVKTALLQVARADHSLVVAVQRLEYTSDPLMALADGIITQAQIGKVTDKREGTLAGNPALLESTSGTVNGVALTTYIGLVRTNNGIWLVMAAVPTAALDQNQEAIARVFNSFSLGQ